VIAAGGPDGTVLDAGPGCRIPVDEVRWRFGPSSGPGGQHANRAHTRAEATLDLVTAAGIDEAVRRRLVERLGAEVRVVADETRSQHRNRAAALERLEARLRSALVVRARRRPTRPGRGAVERRLSEKRRTADRKRQRQVRPED
jgi:ribosome-associated protein